MPKWMNGCRLYLSKAGSFLLSHLVLQAFFNILSEASEEVNENPYTNVDQISREFLLYNPFKKLNNRIKLFSLNLNKSNWSLSAPSKCQISYNLHYRISNITNTEFFASNQNLYVHVIYLVHLVLFYMYMFCIQYTLYYSTCTCSVSSARCTILHIPVLYLVHVALFYIYLF